jgi:aminopeptidase N
MDNRMGFLETGLQNKPDNFVQNHGIELQNRIGESSGQARNKLKKKDEEQMVPIPWQKSCNRNAEGVSTSTRHGMHICLVILLCSLLPPIARSQSTARWYYEPQYEPPEHQVDMEHMRLMVSFLPEEGLVRGTVTHIFTPLRDRVDTLFLNGPGITILNAVHRGHPLPFLISPDGITFRFSQPLRYGERDSITLKYEAHPRLGIFFVGWNDSTHRSRKQIWTQGQGINNRHWIPCYDEQNDKLTTETIITFDSRYRVLSNGAMVSRKDNGNGSTTWHYRMTHPHSVYLVMLGIGRYDIDMRRSKSGVPLYLWYYPEERDRVEPTYRYSAEAIDFMERETGVPYPWESYAQIPVQDFMHGAMENTTATVFGDFLLLDRRSFLDRNYISVNVHELAHQWFGDYITGRSGRNSWLHESFATFYPKLFLREIADDDAYQWARKREQETALAASEKNLLPILHSGAGSDRVYSKGSAVIDMMRYTFGEEAVRRVITHYLRAHAYGLVESNDLYQAFQDVLGLSPYKFFEQWIYRGGEPHYRVAYQDVHLPQQETRQTRITVSQIHGQDELTKLFAMPVVFEVHYTDGSSDRKRVHIERETEDVVVPNAGKRSIAYILFDPGSWIIKHLTFDRSFAELRAQALNAPLMIDRYDAVRTLRDTALAVKRELLVQVYGRERFHAARGESVTQLATDSNSRSMDVVRRALRDTAVEVRSAALAALPVIPPALREGVEGLLTDSSYAIVASALTILCEQYPEHRDRYLSLTRGVKGVGNQVRVLWYEMTVRGGLRAALDSLVDMASPAYEFRTRVNAFESLLRLNYLNESLVQHLYDAMTHANGRLRNPATDVTRGFIKQSSYRALLLQGLQNRAWPQWKKDMITPVFEAP